MIFVKADIAPELVSLIPDFIKYTLLDYEKLSSFYKLNDIGGMSSVCHTILGSAKSYGFFQLDQIVFNLQKALKDGDEDSLQKWFETLSRYAEFLKEQYC